LGHGVKESTKINFNISLSIMASSSLHYKFNKELTTKGSWLTDEPISFMINEFRKDANKKHLLLPHLLWALSAATAKTTGPN